MTRVGLISDTHGLLRAEAVRALEGCSRIIHAGDVGKKDVLERLGEIAPVYAVRGNVDAEPWPLTRVVEVEDVRIWVVHILPASPPLDYDCVVYGHSHRASIERRPDTLFVNPGSAGPRRFRLPITLAILHVNGADVSAEIVALEGAH